MFTGVLAFIKSSAKRRPLKLLTPLRFSYIKPNRYETKDAQSTQVLKDKQNIQKKFSQTIKPANQQSPTKTSPTVVAKDKTHNITKENAQQVIKKWITDHDVCLFLKGTVQVPLCGYSNYVVERLKHFGINPFAVNVLQNGIIREEIKKFSRWNTFPQLYIKGVFQGGADVIRQMIEDQTWQPLLRSHKLIV